MTGLFVRLRAQRRALLLALGALAALGVALGARLPMAILPEVTFPRITIIAESGERPGEEMLRAVTRTIEEGVRRVPGVREIRSTTSRGSSEIDLDCEWNTPMDLTLQRVQATLDAARDRVPAGTSMEARLMNPALFPVLGFSLTSGTLSLAELRDLAVMRLQPELARLPGAAEVVVQGGRRFEARVTLDPTALESRGLDAAAVAARLRAAGELEAVGLLDANRQLYLGLSDARPADLAALEALPIPVTGGPPVVLGALGRVSLEEAPEFTRYAAQSREAVLINLMRQPHASTVALADAAHRWFATHPAALPPGVRLETFYDQSDLVRESIGGVRDSLLVGALMALIIVILFLGSLRLGLAGAIVLPGSIALTLLGLALARQSLNMMSLGGIAAAVGLVLDDAIVVVEHLAHRAARDGASFDSAAAMAEILPSLIGSSLCTIAIFAPFMLLGGVAGAFFKVLALSMTLMLSSSWLLCVTLVPLFGRLRHRPARAARERRLFPGVLRFALARPSVAILPAIGLIVLAIPLQRSLGSGFLPEMDEGSLILDYVAPPGTSASETSRMLGAVEHEIDATPEVAAWSRRTGDQLGFFITEPNNGDYTLRLHAKRHRGADDVADDLRARIEAAAPALQIEFGQLVEDVIGDLTTNPQPIEVRVFSEDRRLDEQKAREIAALIGRVPGVVDVKDGVVVSGPNLSILPGEGAARLGLDAQSLADAVKPAVAGLEAGQIVRGARVWPVRVVLPPPELAARADALAALRVPVTAGHWVPLGDLATLRVDPGETEIRRDNLRTLVAVTARLSNRDLGSAMADIQARLRRTIALAPGMSLGYGGLWAEQQSSFRGLAAVLAGAAAAVLLILLVAFRSTRLAAAVMLVVSASLAGVFAALHIGGATFNISSFVGAIMTVGVVAENAFFLVAQHRAELAAGATPAEAAERAARRRARPVLMTTAAGVAALAPLALGFGSGGSLLQPLAIAVVGGFVLSAPLLLLALPALLARSGRIAD